MLDSGCGSIHLRPTLDSAWTAVLLDRQPLWLDALESLLARHEIVTLAATTSTAAAYRDVRALAPQTFVLDPWLDDESMTGLELIARVRSELPRLRIVCLGTDDSPAQIDRTFAAGANAYVLNRADAEEVAQAIRHVSSESTFFPASARPPTPSPHAALVGSVRLTKREREILRIVAEGHSNGEIARRLWVTQQTVKFHLANIYRKLGVSNRTEAGRWAHLHDLVADDDPR